MDNTNADEIHKIVQLTLENTFDTIKMSHFWPEVESEESPFLVVKGMKSGKKYPIKLYYKELFAEHSNGTLPEFLLKACEDAIKNLI